MRRITWVLFSVLLSGCATRLQISQLPDIRLGDPSFFPTIAADTNAPILGGNRVRILLNGDETFPAMLREIRTAKQTINFAQYLYGEGKISYEFAEAFAERCRAGVKVNILLDSYGADDIPVDIPELMKRAGCNAEFFHRIKILQFITPWELFGYNYRSHRRVLVIDGRIGFTGGYGISAAWTGDGRTPEHWRDTNVEVEGPIVQWLQAAFVDSWHETTGILLGGDKYFPHLEPRGDMLAQVVKSSPLAGSSESYTLFLLSISSAKKSILISNPYFIPDEHIAEALVKAVARGVRVIVLVPNKIDNPLTHAISRSGYGPLLRGGVQIYEYTAALLHSKTMVIDGTWATIGSTNLDSRSLALNEELNLTVYNSSLANRLEQIFYQDLKYARQVSLKEWNSRSLAERFLELFAFPLKDQL